MLYNLLQQTQKWLDEHGLYQIVMVLNQLEFRAFFAVVISFVIVLMFGNRTILWLLKQKIGDAPEFWVPMAMQPEVRPPSAGALRARFADMRMLHARDIRWLDMVGRLQEGTSVAEAAAALDVVGRRLQTETVKAG